MNSIHIINKQSSTGLGAGLPFYEKKEFQYRNFERSYGISDVGYWRVPTNRLPTFQVAISKDLAASDPFNLVPVVGGIDQTPIALPEITYLQEYCFDRDGNTDNSFWLHRDQDIGFILDEGLYYFTLETLAGDTYYSELFKAGGICCGVLNATFQVVAGGGPGTVNILVTFDFKGVTFTMIELEVLATLYPTSPQTINIPQNTNVNFDFTVQTSCGVFFQRYVLNYDGVTLTVVKIYQ